MTFWVAGAAIVGSVGGALINSKSTSNAVDTQAASTASGIAEQQRQYDLNRSDQEPYRATGSAALGQMSDLLGIQPAPGAQGAQGFNEAAYLAANPDVAAYIQAHPPGSVGATTALQHYQLFGQKEGRPLGTPAPGTPGAKSAEFGSYAKPITADQVQMDPGYEFGLKQGQQAIDRKTAAAGGRISGASLKAAAQYGTDYATTGYSTAYNRVNQARSDRLNRLAALAGIGQTATQQTGTAGTNSANQISSLTTAQGNASAAGQLAQGNIWSNAGNQIAALYGRNSGGVGPMQTYNPSGYSSTGGDFYYGAGQNYGV